MATSHSSTPIWHVAAALVLALVAAVAGQDGSARAAPRDGVTQPPPAAPGGETYRGYRLDLSAAVEGPDAGSLRKAAEHQVDIVEATGLDARTKAFLRGFPVVVRRGSGEGSHYDGGDSVAIAVTDANDDRPILLHEFMHLYHFRRMAGGKANPDIRTFYERARAARFYPPRAYALRNAPEFFAMTASVFLHGRLAREPFTHDEMRRNQPAYDRYLVRLFGTPGA